MTASDARPPSDTGTTGWHTHSGRAAYRDDQCTRHDDDVNPARPVIVVDPAETRETIARAVHETHWQDAGLPLDFPTCGHTSRPGLCMTAGHVADHVLAALAGQVQP